MEKRNFSLEMDRVIATHEKNNEVPTLLLHSCCAPCSTAVLTCLTNHFSVTVYYYNPNIYPDAEYEKRAEEQRKLIEKLPSKHPVKFILGEFEKDKFYEAVRGLEDSGEGGARCKECFTLRLTKTAELAKNMGFDYFTTTLSVSPLKNAQLLNALGEEIGQKYGISYLPSDFKKKDGYKKSVELSREYGLYRQDYCGCLFSRNERNQREEKLNLSAE